MRLPRRSTPGSDAPEGRHRRRAVIVAGGLVVALAGASAYVVVDRDTVEQAAPIFTTGSTFIEPLEPRGPSASEQPRRERRPERDSSDDTSSRTGGPRSLVIPTLGVDSAIVPITAPGGRLTPPHDAQQLGWWSDGAEPGAEQGSALVTGHTLSSGSGALQDLETMVPGDLMTVRTAEGSIDYRVQEVEVFSKGAVAAEAQDLFSQSAPGRLVVITCEDYDGFAYLSNVVVTATPVDSPSVDA